MSVKDKEPAEITTETAARKFKDIVGIFGSIFKGEKMVNEALSALYTIAEKTNPIVSEDGYACAFLSRDKTIGGNVTITPGNPNEVSITTAHIPGLSIIAALQMDIKTQLLAAGIRIIPDNQSAIEYFFGKPNESNPQSALLAMYKTHQQRLAAQA